jgi:hypothetical protein
LGSEARVQTPEDRLEFAGQFPALVIHRHVAHLGRRALGLGQGQTQVVEDVVDGSIDSKSRPRRGLGLSPR